jgi:hypothetical protein
MPRMSRIRPQTVHRPASPIWIGVILDGDPVEEAFRGSQMRARGSSVKSGFAWSGLARVAPASGGKDSAASELWLGWGGASGGGKWGETERRSMRRFGQGLGIAGRARLWSLDVCSVDGSDRVLRAISGSRFRCSRWLDMDSMPDTSLRQLISRSATYLLVFLKEESKEANF